MGDDEHPQPSSPSSRAEALRAAVDQAFGATAREARNQRDRAEQLADELAGAAGRVKDLLDDLRPAGGGDDLKALQQRIDELEARVAELERRP